MLVHSERVLRHTNGTIISVMVGHSGLWPDLLSALAQCMDSEDVNAVDGALDTLFKVSFVSFANLTPTPLQV